MTAVDALVGFFPLSPVIAATGPEDVVRGPFDITPMPKSLAVSFAIEPNICAVAFLSSESLIPSISLIVAANVGLGIDADPPKSPANSEFSCSTLAGGSAGSEPSAVGSTCTSAP